jgi:hypothetical protein
MKKVWLCFSIVLLIGCRQSSNKIDQLKFMQNRADYLAFRQNARYDLQNIGQVIGRYECGVGFGGESFDIFIDSTFQYRYWSDVVGSDPVKEIHGRYYLSNDSLVFIFQKYEYWPNLPGDKISSFQNSIESKLRLVRLSERYSPCFLTRIDKHVFLFRHDQMDELQHDFQQLNKFSTTVTLGNGQTVSERTLMHIGKINKQ